MKKIFLVVCFTLGLFFLFTSFIGAMTPFAQFVVEGRIVESNTQTPVEGVKVLVFVNNSTMSRNTMNEPEHDYPNLPETDKDGYYKATCWALRETPMTVFKTEVITLKEGYVTTRRIFENPTHQMFGSDTGGKIQIPDMAVRKSLSPTTF